MAPPETSGSTQSGTEDSNTNEVEENDLKNRYVKLTEALKEQMRITLNKKRERKPRKNKQVKEMVQDLKTEIETMKKTQRRGFWE